MRTWDELPENAKAYLKKIEEITESTVVVASVGPNRDETIVRPDNLYDAIARRQ
ncbi:MAG: adenylosuccinate synthetase [Candidatus Omnitrophica bacterium]|nr:adenylosuccinate synthetase [Candidatus Omnitrophota bacterium]